MPNARWDGELQPFLLVRIQTKTTARCTQATTLASIFNGPEINWMNRKFLDSSKDITLAPFTSTDSAEVNPWKSVLRDGTTLQLAQLSVDA